VQPDDYEYAVSKAKAEAVVRHSMGRGCPAVIFRLPNVYGPFSRPYTVRLVDHLLAGIPVIVGSGETPSNTMYVDNVVEAIVRAIEAPDHAVVGEIFTINDDQATWAEYVRPYATALGMPVEAMSTDALDTMRAAGRRRPLRAARRALHNVREVLDSQELKALAARVMTLEPLGALPRWALDRVPGFRLAVRKALHLDGPEIYSSPTVDNRAATSPDLHLMNIYACAARVSSEKARRVLGDFSVVPRSHAMELTIGWCRHAGLSGRFDV